MPDDSDTRGKVIRLVNHTTINSSRYFAHRSPRVSSTNIGGTEPFNAILGVVFPLHKPYIQLI